MEIVRNSDRAIDLYIVGNLCRATLKVNFESRADSGSLHNLAT